jgi:hypothetical protein
MSTCNVLQVALGSLSEPTSYMQMPPEPWGRKLGRARWDLNHYTIEDAVRLAGYYTLTSAGTISRLESMTDVPSGPRQQRNRQVAYVLCRAYRVDPAEFGLSDDDNPPGVTLAPRSEDSPSTIWYQASPSVLALSIAA